MPSELQEAENTEAAPIVTATNEIPAGPLADAVAELSAKPRTRPEPSQQGEKALAGLPLTFVENQGQWGEGSRFVARYSGTAIAVEPNAITIFTPKGEAFDPVSLRFESPREEVLLEGLVELPGIHNFIVGSDPADWHTGVPGFAGVRYVNLWEGIDLEVYEGGPLLEYDLIVGPEADLGSAVLSCGGVESLELREDGSLIGSAGGQELVQEAPVAWYLAHSGERQPVDCKYRLLGNDRFGFEVAEPAEGRTLVVDPVFMRFNSLQWSTFLGGTGDEIAYDVAVAQAGTHSGEVTVVGETTSTNFPTTNGTNLVNGKDVFVTRLNPAGSGLVFSTYIGSLATGTVCNEAALGVDLAGSAEDIAVVTGWFENKPNRTCIFPVPGTANAWDTCACKNGRDAFVTRLNATGGLTYTTYLGGVSEDEGWDIKVVPNPQTQAMEVVVAGWTDGGGNPGVGYGCGGCALYLNQSFQTTSGALQTLYAGPTGPGGSDGFIAPFRLAVSGFTDLQYSTFHGGTSGDQAFGLALDPDPSLTVPGVYVVGSTSSTNFPTTFGSFSPTAKGGGDAFVSHLTLAGGGTNDLLASTYLGGLLSDGASDVVFQVDGPSTYVTTVGSTFSNDFPKTVGAFDTTHNGGSDAFVTRLNGALSSLVWSTYLGGSSDDSGLALCVVPGTLGVNVTGETASSDFPVTSGGPLSPTPWDGTHNGLKDVFVVRFKQNGGFSCGTFLGADGNEVGHGISPDGTGEVVVVGSTSSSGFPTTSGAFQTSYQGGSTDAFVTKLRIATLGQ